MKLISCLFNVQIFAPLTFSLKLAVNIVRLKNLVKA